MNIDIKKEITYTLILSKKEFDILTKAISVINYPDYNSKFNLPDFNTENEIIQQMYDIMSDIKEGRS